MKVFDRAISLLGPVDQNLLQATLSRWRDLTDTGRHVDWNLRNEKWLPAVSMEQLQRTLAACASAPVPDIETKYQIACYAHVCKGGVASPTPTPTIVGHVVDRADFATYLTNDYPAVFPDSAQAELFIDKLLSAGKLTDDEKKLRVRRYIMWATFELNSAAGPFDFASTDLAEEIRACLALDQRNPTGPLLLFCYSWAASTDMLRPTVADAGLHYNFQQAGVGTHGLTRPWAKGVHRNGTAYETKPRPEVVHYPVALGAVLKVEARDD